MFSAMQFSIIMFYMHEMYDVQLNTLIKKCKGRAISLRYQRKSFHVYPSILHH